MSVMPLVYEHAYDWSAEDPGDTEFTMTQGGEVARAYRALASQSGPSPKADAARRIALDAEGMQLLALLYTHSPSGPLALSCACGFDVRVALADLALLGKVISRQVGAVTIYALPGAMGG